MTYETRILEHRQVRRMTLLSRAATAAPVLAGLAACGITTAHNLPIAIERPAVLMAAALLLLLPCRRPTPATLQKVVLLYLFCIPVSEVHLRFFALSVCSWDVRVSYSTIPLAILAAGYLAQRRSRRPVNQELPGTDFPAAWLIAGAVLVVHMAVLALLLHSVYGYGYEQDLNTLGSFALYFLVFLTSWRQLEYVRLRQILALIFTVFYSVVASRC
jgi:hypothetical protein